MISKLISYFVAGALGATVAVTSPAGGGMQHRERNVR